jgi:hypothetical protein
MILSNCYVFTSHRRSRKSEFTPTIFMRKEGDSIYSWNIILIFLNIQALKWAPHPGWISGEQTFSLSSSSTLLSSIISSSSSTTRYTVFFGRYRLDSIPESCSSKQASYQLSHPWPYQISQPWHLPSTNLATHGPANLATYWPTNLATILPTNLDTHGHMPT